MTKPVAAVSHMFTRVCDGSATRLDFGDEGEEMTRAERGENFKKNKTLQACSSCGLHLLWTKQWILRPLWGLMQWGIPREALQPGNRLQAWDQCSLTFRRHNPLFTKNFPDMPLYSSPDQRQALFFFYFLLKWQLKKQYQPIFYIFGIRKKKICQAAKYPYHRYFVFCGLLKLAQLSHNWEQALNEVGVRSHCFFHLIHSDDSIIITQIHKTSLEYGNNILQCCSIFKTSPWSIRHVSVMTSTGSVLPLDLCLRLRRLCERAGGVGPVEGVAVATERERRSVSGCFPVVSWGGSTAVNSRRGFCSLSVSWRHLSKQLAVKVWWAPR